jgi:hypothetical protein
LSTGRSKSAGATGLEPAASAVTGQQRRVSYWILTVLTARSRSSKEFFDPANRTQIGPWFALDRATLSSSDGTPQRFGYSRQARLGDFVSMNSTSLPLMGMVGDPGNSRAFASAYTRGPFFCGGFSSETKRVPQFQNAAPSRSGQPSRRREWSRGIPVSEARQAGHHHRRVQNIGSSDHEVGSRGKSRRKPVNRLLCLAYRADRYGHSVTPLYLPESSMYAHRAVSLRAFPRIADANAYSGSCPAAPQMELRR